MSSHLLKRVGDTPERTRFSRECPKLISKEIGSEENKQEISRSERKSLVGRGCLTFLRSNLKRSTFPMKFLLREEVGDRSKSSRANGHG